MPKPFIGVRWWLGVAFAVVAATSTAIVVSQFSDRSEAAFRRHAEALALKDAQTASRRNVSAATLDRVASKLQGSTRLHLFGSAGAPAKASRLERDAVTTALSGENFVKGTTDGGMYVAAIPLAFVRPWIADALYAAVALTWFVPDRRIESRLNHRANAV